MPTPAEDVYPGGPKQGLGNGYSPDQNVPTFPYGEVGANHMSGHLPGYSLPRLTTDDKGIKVVEAAKDAENDLDATYSQLSKIAKSHTLKHGDKVLLHGKDGAQTWYSKDDEYDYPGYKIWFPPEPGV
jgi:hypothetical protein